VELEISPGERAGSGGFILPAERAGRAGIVGWVESWQRWFCRLGTDWGGRELVELEMLAGERAGRAGNFSW